ncbi:MAG TPA: hypothetical protein VMU67_13725 [Steroidobacteraceae bacterium]|nr:hypothetical protein [Steroidobacteraceae bacterium]
MSALMTAIFEGYPAAERVRLDLVRDGFPTDRVELTADCDLGRAALTPASGAHERIVQYFRTLFPGDEERALPEHLAVLIDHGDAAVTVHPRGPLETARAREIIDSAHPLEIVQHDLAMQHLEFAAARNERPWIRAFWAESGSHADCIYCRLFERD